VTVFDSLRKNARFLLSGFLSAISILVVWRAVDGSALIQPQSDFGIVLGAFAVAAYVVIQDLRESNGSKP
jgi:hypothetical protein